MKHYMIVFGTRPELIKMFPLIKECQNHTKQIKLTIVNTGQQKEMVDILLKEWNIKPQYDLEVMKPKQTLTELNINIMTAIEPVIKAENPDLVLVHGDTTTAFITSLVAFYQQKKIGHIEAGLRTNNKYAPFPEEMNRQLIDRVADYYFVPTKSNKENLEKEGVTSKIEITGNTGIDTLSYLNLERTIASDQYQILVTIHRRELAEEKLRKICEVLRKIAKEYPDVVIKYPVHLNPRIQKIVGSLLSDQVNIILTEPLNYLEFQQEMVNSFLVVTDSGGIQEEAPYYKVPVLVVREVTERQEAVEAGYLKIIGIDEQRLYKTIVALLTNQDEYEAMQTAGTFLPFGDGKAAKRIVDCLLQEV
ncbi:hypothetical protein ATZ33_10040 [Enterococcus silesiacus]|nr:UDP-N-acetylglucosamine 2-epimerase (non-hydrolyzing) [Enterococcus silesiacus]ALS01698.1 hypothetical protein ATZ33_10040 [Enterococcus silesiacus]